MWDTRKEALSLNSSSNRTSDGLDNVVFSPNGKYIAASAWGDVVVWNGMNGSTVNTFTGHTRLTHSLTFSPDSTILASYSWKDGVFIWDLGKKGLPPRKLSNSNTTDNNLPSFTTREERILRIVFSATGNQLAVVFIDNESNYSFWVRIWDVSKYKEEESAEAGIEIIQSKLNGGYLPRFIRFATHDPLLFVRHWDQRRDSKVIVWDCVNDTMEERDYDENTDAVLKHTFYVEDGWIVSGRAGRRLLWLPESRRPGYGDSFAAHENLFAIGTSDGVFSLLDMSPFIDL
jgi:WD40 repeat protein